MPDEELTERVVTLREDAPGWRQVDGPRLTEDDPFLTGLGEEQAEALVRSNWALQHASVEDARAFYGPPDEEEDAEPQDGDGETAAENATDEDVTSWENWNEEDWLDLGYQQRAEDVQAGLVDDHLDTIADVETSDTVVDAVENRQADLTDTDEEA